MKSQQAILAATEFVIDLNKAVASEADMTPSYQRMMELETFLEPLITESEQWVLNCPMTQPVDNDEAVVAHSLRCMARIKLNRLVTSHNIVVSFVAWTKYITARASRSIDTALSSMLR